MVLDTNLLLLYVVGLSSVDAISKVKRTKSYTPDDFRLLSKLLRNARGLILTPNVVTETSNFLHTGVDSPVIRGATAHLVDLMNRFGERYESSAHALAHANIVQLGVSDCVMLLLGRTGAVLLTADADLWEAAQRAKLKAVNFNHERESARYRDASRY